MCVINNLGKNTLDDEEYYFCPLYLRTLLNTEMNFPVNCALNQNKNFVFHTYINM